MYAAVVFLGGANTPAVQSVVAVERTVFYRERAAGMYSALPYAFSQVTEALTEHYLYSKSSLRTNMSLGIQKQTLELRFS